MEKGFSRAGGGSSSDRNVMITVDEKGTIYRKSDRMGDDSPRIIIMIITVPLTQPCSPASPVSVDII